MRKRNRKKDAIIIDDEDEESFQEKKLSQKKKEKRVIYEIESNENVVEVKERVNKNVVVEVKREGSEIMQQKEGKNERRESSSRNIVIEIQSKEMSQLEESKVIQKGNEIRIKLEVLIENPQFRPIFFSDSFDECSQNLTLDTLIQFLNSFSFNSRTDLWIAFSFIPFFVHQTFLSLTQRYSSFLFLLLFYYKN